MNQSIQNYRAALAAMKQDRNFYEWVPTLEKVGPFLIEVGDLLPKLQTNANRLCEALDEYHQLQVKGPGPGPKHRANLAFFSSLRLKLITICACEDNAVKLVGKIQREIELFIEVADDLYRGPLAEAFCFLIPIIPRYATSNQLARLRAGCSRVAWPETPCLT